MLAVLERGLLSFAKLLAVISEQGLRVSYHAEGSVRLYSGTVVL